MNFIKLALIKRIRDKVYDKSKHKLYKSYDITPIKYDGNKNKPFDYRFKPGFVTQLNCDQIILDRGRGYNEYMEYMNMDSKTLLEIYISIKYK